MFIGKKILIIEDDIDINELLMFNLQNAGYEVKSEFSGSKGLKTAETFMPDLILLDIMLPDIDGFEVCRKIKNNSATSDISIIMLTAKGEDSDVILGLELGADDYVSKPFSTGVLLARIRTVLKRNSKTTTMDSSKLIKAGGLVIDEDRRKVTTIDGEQLSLTVSEFDILKLLASKPGRVFSRSMIIDSVKGGDYPVTERSVDVQILALRRKLGKRSDLIETVRGIGYKFKDQKD